MELCSKSRNSSVGIATDYGLDDRMITVLFSVGAGNFSLRHRVQTNSGSHPASYPKGIGGSFRGGKAAGAWSWQLPSSAEVKECVVPYLHSLNTSSSRGAEVKPRELCSIAFSFNLMCIWNQNEESWLWNWVARGLLMCVRVRACVRAVGMRVGQEPGLWLPCDT
jgi:hypothetical protein